MARPGKAIFDVTMMAGWAFAAVLTGLVALTMVDETGVPANNSSVVATLENDDARLVTGSVPKQAVASSPKDKAASRQDQSYNPFDEKSVPQSASIPQILAELKAVRQEVQAFHVSARRLRDENDRLKQRVAKLELARNGATPTATRLEDISKPADFRNPFIIERVQLKPTDGNQNVDTRATGSIAPARLLPQGEQSFDPFANSGAKTNQARTLTVSAEPLMMDMMVEGQKGRMMLPKVKPGQTSISAGFASKAQRPLSQVISLPKQTMDQNGITASHTTFGLDLGQFVSLADLGAAWAEIAISQRDLVGDLKPLSRKVERVDNKVGFSLVVGPIQNAARAASLCAQLRHRDYDCRVAAYRGQVVGAH